MLSHPPLCLSGWGISRQPHQEETELPRHKSHTHTIFHPVSLPSSLSVSPHSLGFPLSVHPSPLLPLFAPLPSLLHSSFHCVATAPLVIAHPASFSFLTFLYFPLLFSSHFVFHCWLSSSSTTSSSSSSSSLCLLSRLPLQIYITPSFVSNCAKDE